MAVTNTPTELAARIKDYQLANPNAQLTHLAIVSTAPRSLATPGVAGGFFDVWYDPGSNTLILDYTSTQP